MEAPVVIEARLFADDGQTPNHPQLPLVVYRTTVAARSEDPAAWFERHFTAHDWGATWRWHVYDYQHFHSTNHEVLGVSRGHARLRLGGENGSDLAVALGDVLVLPAGCGHMSLEASADFQVVGAYPGGREPDLLRPGQGDAAEIRRRIAAVPLPAADPVFGAGGRLFEHWGKPGGDAP